MEVGRVGSLDHLERLVITGGSGELFKPRLRDKCRLDVGPCGKLKKRFAQAGLKTIQRDGIFFSPTNHRLLIGGVQAEGQHPRASVAVKHQVLIGLNRENGQLP